MNTNDLILKRLAQTRVTDLTAQADRHRLLAPLRSGWRHRLAQTLVAAAERLEPEAVPQRPLAGA